jgi:hypothetical protein
VKLALPRRLIWTFTGVVVGLLLGFTIGWWWWPVQYTNTAPSALRQDYGDEYIVMVASAYEVEGDLERARDRLRALDGEAPAAPVVELAERLVEAGGDPSDIIRLAHLVEALGATMPTLLPYTEAPP